MFGTSTINPSSSSEPFSCGENGNISKRKRRPAGTPGRNKYIHGFDIEEFKLNYGFCS